MILIAVDSVFQLISALNIAFIEYPEHEIIVLIKSGQSNSFWGKINTGKFIYDIYYTNPKYENHLSEILWQIMALVLPRNATRNLINDKVINFKVSMIIASPTWLAFLPPIYNTFKKTAKLYFIEEGIGTYTKQEYLFGNMTTLNLIKFILLRRKSTVNKGIFRLLVPNYLKNKHVKFVEKYSLSTSSKFKELLIELFDCEQDVVKLNGSRIIYFEQIFNMENDFINKNNFNEKEELLKKIILSNQNGIIKGHPRYSKVKNDKYPACISMVPWEAIMTAIDINNKILVSIFSTSIVTPKIMQNKEPMVICLAKVFEKELKLTLPKDRYNDIDNLINFFSYIKSTYNDPNRFMIPSSIDELEHIIKKTDYFKKNIH